MDSKNNTVQAASAADAFVEIKTSEGDIKVRLFGDTPKHRDNFLKLVKEGYYDNVLFHRVINEFMVQTGDPDSKNAPIGKMLGAGGPGYTLDAEIVYPGHFHKRGALAAARQATRSTRNAVLQARNSISLQERLIMIQPFPRWNGRWK